jgi:hypothetical protein
MKIIIREHEGHGVYDAFVDGEKICRSRTPLFTAARVLLARGVPPETSLEMWRTATWAMRAPIWAAAKLTVKEGTGRATFAVFEPFPDRPSL